MFVPRSQAANFDNWNSFVLLSGILALITAAVFVLGSWKVADSIVMLVVEVDFTVSLDGDHFILFRRGPLPAAARRRR